MGVLTITIARSKAKPRRTSDKGPSLATLYAELYERLQQALDDCLTTTHDDFNPEDHPHAPAGQSNGGQFVSTGGSGGPTGPKPTSVKAKLTKAALHELLSTGHAFTKKELLNIMGPEHKEVTVSTWLSKFKSQKHAGEYGALDIKKLPNGSYQVVMPDGSKAPPAPPMPNLIEDLEKEKAVKVEPVKMEQPKTNTYVQVPAALFSKDKADDQYADSILEAQTEALSAIDQGGAPEVAVVQYKKAKVIAMAQWKTNITGIACEPKVDNKVYEADKILAKALASAWHEEEDTQMEATLGAFNQWKHNTALEKQGKLGAAPAPKPDTKPLSQAVSHWTEELKNVKPVVAKPYEHLVPKGFKHISGNDFAAGKKGFQAGILKLKSELVAKSADAVANKKTVEKDLAERLKDKPFFQAMKKAYTTTAKTLSLEAKLIQTWASSSGDGNKLSCAVQLAVQDAFALPDQHLTKQQLHAIKDHNGDTDLMSAAAQSLGIPMKSEQDAKAFRQGLQEFVHAQYESTQEMFKSLGHEHVFLARGMKVKAGGEHLTHEPANVKLQPASSFSANYGTASNFAGPGGTVYLVKVPVSQVLSTYMSGFGCTNEHEVVVLGHETIKSYPVQKGGSIPETSTLSTACEAVKKRLEKGKKI